MFYHGSLALTAHPRQKCAFLIQQIDVDKPKSDWFKASVAWEAMLEAQRVFGSDADCLILQSALASDYDAFSCH